MRSTPVASTIREVVYVPLSKCRHCVDRQPAFFSLMRLSQPCTYLGNVKRCVHKDGRVAGPIALEFKSHRVPPGALCRKSTRAYANCFPQSRHTSYVRPVIVNGRLTLRCQQPKTRSRTVCSRYFTTCCPGDLSPFSGSLLHTHAGALG